MIGGDDICDWLFFFMSVLVAGWGQVFFSLEAHDGVLAQLWLKVCIKLLTLI